MIVLTGFDDEELAAGAMKEGAQDYLIKGQIESLALPRALRYAVERQRMEAEADVMRKNEVQQRDDFLSHVSHELRSPLTSICSFSSIIADGLAGQTTPQQDDYLQIILRNVGQLRAMIEDLLEVSHAQTGKLAVELQSVSVKTRPPPMPLILLQEPRSKRGLLFPSIHPQVCPRLMQMRRACAKFSPY